MKYSIEINEKTGTCEIHASGTVRRPQDSFVLLEAAGKVAKEQGRSRFLFDLCEAKIDGSTMGAYETVIDPESHGVSKRLRIAVVYPVITEDEQFMEDVGVNRGASAYKVFDDIIAAREWLAQ